MQNNASGVISHNHPDVKEFIRLKENKIYGKKGRRTRAKERLEKAVQNIINNNNDIKAKIGQTKDKQLKESGYSAIETNNSIIQRMQQELEILKTRI